MSLFRYVETLARWSRRHSRRLLLTAAMLAVLAIGTVGGYGYSQVEAQDDEPLIFCVNPYTGAVHHTESASQCVYGTVLEVNQQGPAGPEGPVGPRGPEGPQGPAGEGVDSFQRVTEGFEAIANRTNTYEMFCPAGEFASSGGVIDTVGALEVRRSEPIVDGAGSSIGWFAVIANPMELDLSFELFAVCAG